MLKIFVCASKMETTPLFKKNYADFRSVFVILCTFAAFLNKKWE